MDNIVKNRHELIFIYDIKYANPNGDPLEENRPRIDEETGKNIVSDVRLKRTVRDYLHEFLGQDIFIIKEVKEDGSIKTREEKIKEMKIQNKEEAKKLLEKYLDLRIFGATIAGKSEEGKGEKVFTWIGPVQFRFGHSLHVVKPVLIKGTSVLPSGEKKTAGTFTETWVLPYSLICFYGVVNENAAARTGMKEKDLQLLLDGIWNGTKNLITRSKVGQSPRLLLDIVYKEKNFHIGDLDSYIEIETEKPDEELRDISELAIRLDRLLFVLKDNSEKIEKVRVEIGENVRFKIKKKEIEAENLVEELKNAGLQVELLNIDK